MLSLMISACFSFSGHYVQTVILCFHCISQPHTLDLHKKQEPWAQIWWIKENVTPPKHTWKWVWTILTRVKVFEWTLENDKNLMMVFKNISDYQTFMQSTENPALTTWMLWKYLIHLHVRLFVYVDLSSPLALFILACDDQLHDAWPILDTIHAREMVNCDW